MSKNKSSHPTSIPQSTKKNLQFIDVVILPIISGYFLIDCVPEINIQDQMGLHWLLLAVLNLISGIFILGNKRELLAGSVFKNAISILYFSFFIISGFSIIVAINKVEGVVIYNRLITTLISFCVFVILLKRRSYLLKYIALVIAVIVLVKTFKAVSEFYNGLGEVDLNSLILSLKSSTGNKNIFAASLVVQLPFIVYGLFAYRGIVKYLFALSLVWVLMAVFIINARASYVGLLLELIVLLFGAVYLFYRNKRSAFFYNIAIVLSVLLTTFFITQDSLKTATKNQPNASYGTFGDRLNTITDYSNDATAIRLHYWSKMTDFIQQRPLVGVGYGNLKLYTTTYTNTILDDNIFSKHPHNDFLEIAGETGIPNSLIYLSLFAVSFFYTVKIVLSKKSQETKFIALVWLAALTGYFIDAFFNFPMERPLMQILFAFVMAVLVTNCFDKSEAEEHKTSGRSLNMSGVLIIFLSAFTLYIHYTVLVSMKAQFVVDNDLNSIDNLPEAMPAYKFDEVKTMFPSFPNIAENSETIGYKEAKYLAKEKRFDEAILLLDSVHKYSPNTIYDYYLTCNIYRRQNKFDSALVYGKLAFYKKPRHFYYYRMASYLAAVAKDSNEVIKMFKLYHTYRQDQQSYSYYAQSLQLVGYDPSELKKIVEEGLQLYPKNKELLSLKDGLAK